MPLDADVAAMLEQLQALDVPPLSSGTPAEARANYDRAPKPTGDHVERVWDFSIPGPGGLLELRAYATSDAADLPVVAFFHGGGWVLSSVDGHDSLARRLAVRSGALVVSVDYRLAPEDPYPAPHDDCWAATRWLADHAAELGGDPTRLAVAGDSAGATIAAGIALRARDEGIPLAFQLLIYPALDRDCETGSMTANGTGYFLTADDMRWFWDLYVPEEHRQDPYAVPMRADSVVGLAPALVQTAEYDPLRDEGEAWAARLRDAGVDVALTRYDGVIHGFVSRWEQIAAGEDAHAEVGAALRAAFGT